MTYLQEAMLEGRCVEAENEEQMFRVRGARSCTLGSTAGDGLVLRYLSKQPARRVMPCSVTSQEKPGDLHAGID